MGVSGVLVAAWLAAADVGAPQRHDDATETVLRGVEHRIASFTTVRGRVVVHYLRSPRALNEAEAQAAVDAARRKRVDSLDLPPFDAEHRNLIDFEFGDDRWRWEIVQLTNSGQRWGLWLRLPAMWRSLDPCFFYRISVCDGERVYEYDRSYNWGSVRTYSGADHERPRDFALIKACILATLGEGVLPAVREHDFEATCTGNETIDGYECRKLEVRHTGEHKRFARAWIVPELGYAAVRQETLYFSTVTGELRTGVVTTARDFREVLPGIWCPEVVQGDRFEYDKGQGAEAWSVSRIVQVLSLEANAPLESIVTPYRFPFDARVQDTSGDEPRVADPSKDALRESDGIAETMQPDGFAMELTSERALALLAQ